jgi:hypothetical protein
LESHLCTSLDLHPISAEACLPELLSDGLPYPGGVEEAPLRGAQAGGEGWAPGGKMANKPDDQGAPEGETTLVSAPNTAENDAEFDIGTIWPALHLSTRRVCPTLSADTTNLKQRCQPISL